MSWMRRTQTLHGELSAITEVAPGDPRWWLVAGGVAVTEPWRPRAGYVLSDAEPGADTFIGFRVDEGDPIAEAITWAHAARAALRELDGQLPEQPLAVTVRRGAIGAVSEPSALDAVAFAIGGDCYWAPIATTIDGEAVLAADLALAISHATLSTRELTTPVFRVLRPVGSGPTPFVTISIGDEPVATARHGHRRGWAGTNGSSHGPWLGIGRAGDLAVVSTCHMVVDGYGHAWLSGRIAEHHAALDRRSSVTRFHDPAVELPPLVAIAGGIPLGVAWRPLDVPGPRVLPLAYALGQLLYREAGRADARFSPTFQIPVAPGGIGDPIRRRRRVVQSVVSLRFDDGAPEPFPSFEARVRDVLLREADGRGLVSRLLAAARAAPAPLAWKRRSISADRPRWLDRVADVIGGRACLSRIRVDAKVPPSCAVSSPSRLAHPSDPLGSCVITVVDDGQAAAITVCGSGLAGNAASATDILDELLATVYAR